MANGEWRMTNDEWRMASGEWRLAPEERNITSKKKRHMPPEPQRGGTKELQSTKYVKGVSTSPHSLATRHSPFVICHSQLPFAIFRNYSVLLLQPTQFSNP
jgi:hypothetical protein